MFRAKRIPVVDDLPLCSPEAVEIIGQVPRRRLHPQAVWNRSNPGDLHSRCGQIDHEVAGYRPENYDLRYILARDWKTLGPILEGKIHIYCGTIDNYYLNNAVVLARQFLDYVTTR